MTTIDPPISPALSSAGRFTLGSILLIAGSVALVVTATVYSVSVQRETSRKAWIGMNYMTPDSLTAKRGGTIPFAFGRYGPGAVMQVEPHGPADAAGIKAGDRVISISGIPVRAESTIAQLAASTRAGDVLHYRIARGADTLEYAIPARSGALRSGRAMSWFYMAVAMASWLIGLFVALRRPGDRRATLFGLTCAAAAASYVGFPLISTPMRSDGIVAAGLFTAQFAIIAALVGLSAMLFSALLLHFALVFPHRRPGVHARPETIHWIYVALVYPLFSMCVAIGGAMIARRTAWFVTAIIAAIYALGVWAYFRRRIEGAGVRERFLRQPWVTMVLASVGTTVLAMIAIEAFASNNRTLRAAIVSIAVAGPAIGFFVLPFAFGIATIVALLRSYRESAMEERQQIRWPLWGIVTSVGFSLIISLVSMCVAFAFESQYVVDVQHWITVLTGLATLIIPLTFAVGILKYRLMDLDVVIRRASIYGASLFVLAIVFIALVAGVGGFIGDLLRVQSNVVTSGATVAVALIAVPAFRRVQGLLDRRFFRTRYDAAAVLRRIGDATATVSDSATLGKRAIEELHGALRCRSAALLVRGGNALVPAAGIAVDPARLARVPVDAALSGFGPSATHARAADVQGPLADFARGARAALLVPARHRGEIHGVIAIGQKLSDEDFTLADLEFLGAAAGQVAAGIASSRSSGQRRELDEAREIQASLLPSQLPAFEGFGLAAMWQPAQEVAGDYYDAFVIEARGLALCVADVTGKGMPAALLMSNLQATVKAFAPIAGSPAAVVERLNRVLAAQLAPGRFVTLFYAEVDADSRTLRFVNAGHNPPLLLRADGNAEWLDQGGPLLGPVRDATYEEGSLTLARGDRVVLYTDGITEAEGSNRELFGEDRLLAAVRAAAAEDAATIQRALLDAVTMHCGGEFQDDATVLVLAVR